MQQRPQTEPVRSTPTNLYLVLGVGVLAMASSSILIRYTQAEGVPSPFIASMRLLIAALALSPFVLRRHLPQLKALPRKDWSVAVLSGAFLALHFITWVTSLEYTSVLLSVVLVTTSPLWVAVLERVFLKAHLQRATVAGLLIAVAGGLVIGLGTGSGINTSATNAQGDLIGGALSLVGAFSVAVYFVAGRSVRAHLSLAPYIWLVYGIAGIIVLVVVFMMQIPVTGYSGQAWILLIATAAIPQLIGHSSLNYAVGYLPATLVSLITQLEPIGSSILALILLGEIPLPVQILGSAIILGGVIFANSGAREGRINAVQSSNNP